MKSEANRIILSIFFDKQSVKYKDAIKFKLFS